MQEQLKEIYELNNSLLKLAENLQDEFSKKNIKRDTLTADLFLLCFFFTKASKTASAVVLLCQQGYTEDAYILVRTIFKILVKLFYVLKDDSIDRARGFILYEKFERKKIVGVMAARNKEKGIKSEEMDELLLSVKNECNDVESKFQISKDKIKWPDKSLEELSREAGLVDLYNVIYRRISLYVHTSARSSESFVSKTDGCVTFYIGPNEKLLPDVLISSFDLFRRIVQEFDNRFNLGYKEKISEVEGKFNKFMQLIMKEK